MTAYAWDLLPPSARNQIVALVRREMVTFRVEAPFSSVEFLCRFAIDALGKADVVEDAWADGEETSAEVSYQEGYERAVGDALDAVRGLEP